MRNEINYVEELFIRANAEIDNRDYVEAKNILEEILEVDASYGRAYNHLGWIYAEILNDNDKAERLYKLAIKYAGNYGAVYKNYIYLLLDKNDLETAKAMIAKAERVSEVDRGNLNFARARVYELSGDLKNAYKCYKTAKMYAVSDGFMSYMCSELDRVRKKMGKWKATWAMLNW